MTANLKKPIISCLMKKNSF